MYAFDFVKPASLADAVTALGAADAQALGGGQTLIPTLKSRLASPAVLVSLGGIEGMAGIAPDAAGRLRIGGGATHAAVARDAAAFYPALAALAGQIGDPAVRSRGTLGGSLANNDPSACYPAAVLASDATVVTNTREIAAADYFEGMFSTALAAGEIITAVAFPVPARAAYAKFPQPASRFALVGVFVAAYPDGVRVAVTGASEQGVFRWAAAEAALGTAFNAKALDGLLPDPDGMIGDLHGTPDYRAHLTAVLTRRAVQAAG